MSDQVADPSEEEDDAAAPTGQGRSRAQTAEAHTLSAMTCHGSNTVQSYSVFLLRFGDSATVAVVLGGHKNLGDGLTVAVVQGDAVDALHAVVALLMPAR